MKSIKSGRTVEYRERHRTEEYKERYRERYRERCTDYNYYRSREFFYQKIEIPAIWQKTAHSSETALYHISKSPEHGL
jgi:hypothetical protein